jgi:hypothetical protein
MREAASLQTIIMSLDLEVCREEGKAFRVLASREQILTLEESGSF